MKYSFIMPYFKRPDHLWNTLLSYRHHYRDRQDYEVIILPDLAGGKEDADTLAALMPNFRDLPIQVVESPGYGGVNPVLARNHGALIAKGNYLVNTNPEVFHKTNVLAQFDEIYSTAAPKDWGPRHPHWNVPSYQNKYNKSGEVYAVCCCENVSFQGRATRFEDLAAAKHIQWYDHPHHNARILHWCSCISRKLYMAIGGFDEQYHKLVGYDDDDFKTKILTLGMPVAFRTDVIVAHIDHDRSHQDETLRAKSLEYYRQKWER